MDSSHSQHSGANTPWTPPSPEELGTRLPAYEVTEILGRGGMGAVYKARQKSLKRWVAIKLLPLVAADDELKFAERFRNEAETMAQMNHPSIVNVYDFGETSDGLLYIVMEFVDGTDVQKMIHGSGLLSGEYALAITAHVCDALAYAHARGVIHRDIKPANILIDQEGNVKVADFGLAKMTDIDYGLTQSNVAMGTPDYVAPEVLSYGMIADHRADLYAIGVMLYQMLTGEVPRGLFKMPSQKGIGADPRFDDIICKAMEPDREDRYQSASDVRQALDVILTTALPKVEEVEESTSAAKSVRFQYAPPQRNTAVMDGETRSPAKAPPKRQTAEGGNRGARTPVRKSSSAGLWLGIGGIVAVLGLGAFIGFGSKVKTTAGSASSNISVPTPSTKLPPVKLPAAPSTTAVTSTLPRDQWIKLPTTAEEFARKGYVDTETKDGWLYVTDHIDILKVAGETGDTNLRNLAFRATIRPSQTKLHVVFELRYQPDGSVYTLEFISPNRLVLRTTTKDKAAGKNVISNLSDNPITAQPMADGTYEVEWSIQGDLIAVTVGGTKVIELRDQTFAGAGRFFFNGQKPALDAGFKDAFIKILPDTSAVTTAPQGRVVDLLPLVDVERGVVAGEWSREGADLVVKAAKPDTNGTPRLQLPYQPPEEYDFEIEFTPESGTNMVGQALSAYQHSFSWFLDGKTKAGSKAGFDAIDGISVASRTDGTTMRSNFLTNGQRHRSTVEVRRNSVRALLNGEPLVTWGSSPKSYERLDISKNEKMRDALHLGLIAYDRAVRFHKITVREITGTGKMDSVTSIDVPPVITNWQDVTESVREMARGTSGLSVENDGTIRHSPEGRFPRLTLTKPDQRDNAVRVRYTGEVQIGLRSNTTNTDYLFVLCEANQTIFAEFHGDEAKKSEKIGPTKTHPPGFEPNREHELLVTMQGTRFRAWMDGVFWGEAHDDSLTEGTTVLIFTPKMVVKKAEIAELAASPADAAALSQTFQGHRYQFLPGNFTWQEATTEAEKLGGHLAVITSQEENDWVWETFSAQLPPQPKENRWMRGWWLGASQSAPEKPWQWLNNESMTFTHWGGGEPRATIHPPRYLWMIHDGNTPATAIWTAQNASVQGGCLVEWDTLAAAQAVAVAAPWTDRLGTMTWPAPWSMKDGVLSSPSGESAQELGKGADVAVRVRTRVAEGVSANTLENPVMALALRGSTVREGWVGFYVFQAYMSDRGSTLLYVEREDKVGGAQLPTVDLWRGKPLPPELIGKREIEWEFRAVGDELSVWADGKLAASAHDSHLTAGRSKLQVYPGIEITALETSGITPNPSAVTNPNGPPNITNWQDVTAAIREKARSIPELVVEDDQVRHAGQGASQRIQLSRDGLRDYAVRVHFTGESQVNLRRDDFGFIYVLCQRTQVIFQRYDKGETAPTILIPTLLHPPGYDSTQPHELLVTMEGSTIRTWLDGRFLGEAHDDTLANGCADIAFTKYCTVQKVEIAELAVK